MYGKTLSKIKAQNVRFASHSSYLIDGAKKKKRESVYVSP